jgi:hypothetical protein
MTTNIKMAVFLDIAPYSLVQTDWRFSAAYCLHRPDDGGSKLLWNVCQYPRRRPSSEYVCIMQQLIRERHKVLRSAVLNALLEQSVQAACRRTDAPSWRPYLFSYCWLGLGSLFLLLLLRGDAGAEKVSQTRVRPSLHRSGMLQDSENWMFHSAFYRRNVSQQWKV